ncbi:hypothetical protein X760_27705 [Mesorhizobium sp. LSHC422A00]|nr:hypothetical protein X760_27705 [Mesorhizobium sp. LSHC422A00]
MKRTGRAEFSAPVWLWGQGMNENHLAMSFTEFRSRYSL